MNQPIRYIITFMSMAVFLCDPSEATMQKQLLKVYQNFGYKGNASESSAFKDQKTGYYTGGHLYARKPSVSSQLASIHLPNASMGCGGIDMYMGGMSFISKGEFMALLKNIGASSTAYAFQLALQTVSPQIKSTLDELQATIQDINALNVNSCEAGATLVGGLWPRTDESQKMLCKSMGSGLGAVSDYAAARQSCGGNNGDPGKFYSKTGSDQFEDVKPYDVNIAWKAIHKNSILLKDSGQDTLMKHVFMSVSGTLVVKVNKQNNKPSRTQVSYFPSKVKKRQFMSGLLRGNETFQVYACRDAEKCLDVLEKSVQLPEGSALLARVSSALESIRTKITSNTPLSEEEISLIDAASIPVLNIMAIELAYRGKAEVINVRQYEDIIAHDIIMSYLTDIINEVEAGLQSFDLDEKTKQQFKQDLMDVRRYIEFEKEGLFKRLTTALRAIEQTLLLEKKALHDFSNQQRHL